MWNLIGSFTEPFNLITATLILIGVYYVIWRVCHGVCVCVCIIAVPRKCNFCQFFICQKKLIRGVHFAHEVDDDAINMGVGYYPHNTCKINEFTSVI